MPGPAYQPKEASLCLKFEQKLHREWYNNAVCGRRFVNHYKLLAWMAKTDTNETGKNVGRLLRELHQLRTNKPLFYDSSIKIATSENPALLVFGILLELGHGNLIHAFRNANIIDKHLESAPLYYEDLEHELEKDHLAAAEIEGIIRDFDVKRWSFNPVTINYDMSRSLRGGQWVLPFLKKESINDKGGTAEVYQVLIQEDYINAALRDAIKKSRFHDKDLGWVSRVVCALPCLFTA